MLYGGYVNVGCAVNHCNDEMTHKFSLVVCLFQRGWVWGKGIFRKFKKPTFSRTVPDADLKVPFRQRCQTNADCGLYSSSVCETNTGLCVGLCR